MSWFRGFVCGLICAGLLVAAAGRAMSARDSIRRVFGPYSGQALRVSWCESHRSIYARNGSHLGLFQMGENERRMFAHGRYWNAMYQARAAWRYFVASGFTWKAWVCQP